MGLKEAKQQLKEEQSLGDVIIDAIQDIKGKNLVKLDLRALDGASTDYFIICEGDSTTQIKAIANNIHKRIKQEFGLGPTSREGIEHANWVLLDYFDVVVHIFYPETRRYYELEELWGDAKFTEYENL